MEVHPHPQMERKRLKHYLFEFFMLFLAVFCGFLAENLRERFVERKQEIRYMQNLLQDLSRDTAAVRTESIFQKRAVVYADSLVNILNSPERNDHSKDVYFYSRVLTIYNPFFYSNSTVNQLKNSGTLRLITKEFVADSIIQYDIWSQRLLAVEENIKEVIQNFRASMGNVLDAVVIKNMIDTSEIGSGSMGLFLKRPISPVSFVVDDKKNINQLCIYADFLLTLYQYQFKSMNTQKARAIRLIDLLKKEYHLK